MFKLSRYLNKFKKQVVLGPVFKLIEAVFELIVPLVMAKIIDVGIGLGDVGYVMKMGGIMVLLGVVGLGSSLTCQLFAAQASQGFGTVLRSEVFSHINKLSKAEAERFGTSSLTTRITSDINSLQVAVAMLIRLVVRAPFLAIGAVVMAIIIDLKLAVVFLIAIPLVSGILYFIMSKTVPFYRLIQKKLDRLSLLTREGLEGARVIRAFSGQEREKQRFAYECDSFSESSLASGRLSSLLNPLTYLVMNLAITAVLWFGGIRVNIGELTTGEAVAFVNYMTQILLALVVIANLVVLFTRAAASAQRVNEVFDASPSVIDTNQKSAEGGSDIAVEFKNVSFSYGTGETALEKISFTVKKGDKIGVIGTTGSGKTTLANLILRFYDATEGEVLINGVNVKDFTLEELRKKVAVAAQNIAVFNASVRDNISMGNLSADENRIKQALDISMSSEFVEKLSGKYNFMLSQQGKNLSGGQRQRISIARAVAANPEILILDDASSALDYLTEAELYRRISEGLRGLTLFIISQRVNSVKSADKIIVLEDGKMAGIGTHKELYNTCEEYKSFCISQEVEL